MYVDTQEIEEWIEETERNDRYQAIVKVQQLRLVK